MCFYWVIQVVRLVFNIKLWVLLLPQTNSQILPQLSFMFNCNWLLITFIQTHYLFLPIIVNHLRELWQKLNIFCGTRFFTKLLSYLIEPNKIACSWGSFSPLLSFSYKIWTTRYITLSYLQIAFYTISKILSNYFFYCYKSKKLEYQEEV